MKARTPTQNSIQSRNQAIGLRSLFGAPAWCALLLVALLASSCKTSSPAASIDRAVNELIDDLAKTALTRDKILARLGPASYGDRLGSLYYESPRGVYVIYFVETCDMGKIVDIPLQPVPSESDLDAKAILLMEPKGATVAEYSKMTYLYPSCLAGRNFDSSTGDKGSQ